MRILFVGTSEIGNHVLRFISKQHELVGILTQPDRPAGRKKELTPPPIKKTAETLFPSVPLFQPEKLRDEVLFSSLRALQPEVIVTMAYGKILPVEILTLPTKACLNVHVSLLPRHRGASPVQAAIAAGDEKSGITIMHMDQGLDTGDIFLKKELLLDRKETTGTLNERLAVLAPEALQEALNLLAQSKELRTSQQEEEATVTHRLLRKDAFLDWSRPAIVLERLIRAMNPKPGAHGIVEITANKSLGIKIFSAMLLEKNFSQKEKAGRLVLTEDQQPIICCGEGALLLTEVQPEGRSRMSGADFARGYFS